MKKKINSGQKLWLKAKKIIPGGNMFLSKRPEMFLPNGWPTYYSKAKDCYIWDLDNKKYLDASIMGVGTNLLGYANRLIDNSVKSAIIKGNLSSLNSPEEVMLAEKLIKIHPWFDMVKFARTGGEANAIAIRIARAYSGKDNIAICGYHGWHDWYLSTNLQNKNSLNEHLLPGLSTKGVSSKLKNTVYPFKYNDLNNLKSIIKKNKIGVIIMEVYRNIPPNKNFLKNVKKLSEKNGIVLIFDECTSGFRETYGGIHKKYKVYPDIAIFGKALGNGYAITSIIGKKEVMQHAQDSFISSTFWTEKIGYVAALKTLEVMKKEESWKIVKNVGDMIKSKWKQIANENNIAIDIMGTSAIPNFKILNLNNDWKKYKTYISQEMLKQNILASNSIYVCTKHNEKILNKYFENLDTIFNKIRMIDSENSIDYELDGPVCHEGFKRLN